MQRIKGLMCESPLKFLGPVNQKKAILYLKHQIRCHHMIFLQTAWIAVTLIKQMPCQLVSQNRPCAAEQVYRPTELCCFHFVVQTRAKLSCCNS